MSTSTPLTRSKTALASPEFGQPSELPESVIPSWGDVYRYIRFFQLRWRSLNGGGNKFPPNSVVHADVEEKLSAIWGKFTFPTKSPKMIKNSVDGLQEKGKRLMKVSVEKRDSRWEDELRSWNDKMFDISGCTCFDQSVMLYGDIIKMREERLTNAEAFKVRMKDVRRKCPCKTKVPNDEWSAYCDQKLRIGILGPVDTRTTARIQARLQREQNRERLQREEEKRRAENQFVDSADALLSDEVPLELDDRSVEDEDPTDPVDPDFLIARDSQYVPENKLNSHDITNLAIECDRFSVSNAAGAAIANSYLKDLGLLDQTNLLDPLKVRRWRESIREQASRRMFSVHQGLHALAFDGKRVNGLTIDEVIVKKRGGESVQKRRGKKCQEYIVVLTEPEHTYLDHFIPKSGNAADTTTELYGLVASRNSKESLKALSADGAAVNTGRNSGVIRRMELLLEQPLQWVVCLLHMNELLFREHFTKVDGRTSGPRSLEGPIGKAINSDLRSLPVVLRRTSQLILELFLLVATVCLVRLRDLN